MEIFRKMRFNTVFLIFFYLLVFALLWQHSFSYLDPDLGWHLKVGEEMASSQAVPSQNHYNYTYTGDWVDHEWLSNLLSYQVFDSFSYSGLSLMFSLLIVLVLVILTLVTRKILPKIPIFIIAFLQLFGLIASLPHFGVRLQEINLLFLLLLLTTLYFYNKQRKWAYLILLLPLFYLWTNLHGGFLLGLGILFAFGIAKAIEKVPCINRWKAIDVSQELKRVEVIRVFIFFLLSLATTFFTPYYLELYSFLSEYSNTFYLSHIQEWLSQFYFPFKYWQLLYLALAFAFFLHHLYKVFLEKKHKLNIWDSFLFVFFFVLSFQSRRHFPLFFVSSFVLIARLMLDFFSVEGGKKSFFNFGHKLFIIVCFAMVIPGIIINTNYTNKPFESFCDYYPCGAVEFLKNNPQYDDLNIFNQYAWGGFLIWEYPEKTLFIDGRLPQKEFAEHTFLEEYLDFFKEDAEVDELLSEYNVELILIEAKSREKKVRKWERVLFRITDDELERDNYFRDHIAASDDWREVYNDGMAVVFVKNE